MPDKVFLVGNYALMNGLTPRFTEEAINVLLIAKYDLVRRAMKALLETEKGFAVVDSVAIPDWTPAHKHADVAVIHYSPGDCLQIIAELIQQVPGIRVVVIVGRSDLESQTTAIKLGAVGIVQHEQSAKMLYEAIRQTSKGETWLNQVLLNKILSGNAPTLNRSSDGNGQPKGEQLTPRELDVVKMIGEGLKNKEIAERLSITEATVRHHLSSIYGKLNVEDRLNLVILAYEKGILEVTPT